MEETLDWQVGIVCAVVTFVIFVLFHTPGISQWLAEEIPCKSDRALCVGLILAGFVFIVVGMIHSVTKPVRKRTKQRDRSVYASYLMI